MVARVQLDELRIRHFAGILAAYRWQYILSGAQHRPFLRILGNLVNEQQAQRINQALQPLMAA